MMIVMVIPDILKQKPFTLDRLSIFFFVKICSIRRCSAQACMIRIFQNHRVGFYAFKPFAYTNLTDYIIHINMHAHTLYNMVYIKADELL